LITPHIFNTNSKQTNHILEHLYLKLIYFTTIRKQAINHSCPCRHQYFCLCGLTYMNWKGLLKQRAGILESSIWRRERRCEGGERVLH